MKSIEFITEKEVKPYKSKNVTVDQAVATLNKYCSESLSTISRPLWRGMTNHSAPIVVINPSSGKRESQNTSNYYTMIMDHSPYMQGWPKRSRSIVCTTDKGKAVRYGNGWDGGGTYAIFPFNGAKIAVCPAGDMWSTRLPGNRFGMNFTGPASMNDWLESLVLPDSWKEFNKQLNNEQWLDRVKKNIPKAFYKEMIKNPLILLNTLYEVLSPQNAGFKLLSIQQFAAAVLKSNECWVDSQVVAIRQDVYSDFLFAVANGDPPGVSTEEPVSLGK